MAHVTAIAAAKAASTCLVTMQEVKLANRQAGRKALAEHDVKVRLEDRYTARAGAAQLTGVQALVRLPLNVRGGPLPGPPAAGFISGYEGSPLGGYDLELQRQAQVLDSCDVVFRPAVNEGLAATAVQGTQLAAELADARVDGVTGYWYGKSPGLDRACDALRHANLMGTHPQGGAVAFVGDDPRRNRRPFPAPRRSCCPISGCPSSTRPIRRTCSTWGRMPWRCHALRPLGRAEDRHECRRRDRDRGVDSDGSIRRCPS